jgi:myo-inositol catabolism protein IolH
MKIALDPTPFYHTHDLLDFPDAVARLGYEHMQLTPHPDVGPFYRYPKADRALLNSLRKRCVDVGITIPALLPVQRISWPTEEFRVPAVKNFRRIIEIVVELGVGVLNTEFSGRPELPEESEAAFYRSMEELLPVIEREGIRLNIDPHPDDFVEDGLEAWRVIRGLDSPSVGFVYVASHTFHYGDRAESLIPALGDRLGAIYVSDAFDHNRSHGLRYIVNPPTSSARVHQHLKIGDGDVDWTTLFATLASANFFDRDETMIVSNVFAEDENVDDVSRYQHKQINELIDASR